MRGRASRAYDAPGRPDGLMARLAALHGGAIASADHARRTVGSRRTFRAYFSLGFLGSGLVGCLALGALAFAEGDRSLSGWVAQPATAQAEDEGQWFDVPIRHQERARASFALRLVGAAEYARVILRHVPSTAVLSAGERQDEHSWTLRPAELEDLHMTLGEGTPDAFDVTIEVATPDGSSAASIAHVRLVDGPVMLPTASDRRAHASMGGDLAGAAVAPRPATMREDRQSMPPAAQQVEASEPRPVQRVAEAKGQGWAPGRAQVRPHWPAGASALGAVPHEPTHDERRIWWTTPWSASVALREGWPQH